MALGIDLRQLRAPGAAADLDALLAGLDE